MAYSNTQDDTDGNSGVKSLGCGLEVGTSDWHTKGVTRLKFNQCNNDGWTSIGTSEDFTVYDDTGAATYSSPIQCPANEFIHGIKTWTYFEADNNVGSNNFICDDTGITRFEIYCSDPTLAVATHGLL